MKMRAKVHEQTRCASVSCENQAHHQGFTYSGAWKVVRVFVRLRLARLVRSD
jgi:hypothetical protein